MCWALSRTVARPFGSSNYKNVLLLHSFYELAIAFKFWIASVGFTFLKKWLPATKVSAPASTSFFIFWSVTPPSISIRVVKPCSLIILRRYQSKPNVSALKNAKHVLHYLLLATSMPYDFLSARAKGHARVRDTRPPRNFDPQAAHKIIHDAFSVHVWPWGEWCWPQAFMSTHKSPRISGHSI